MQPYAPLCAAQMIQLVPTVDADSLMDKEGNRLIRFAHESK